jgi:hypothetical protein
VLPDLIVSGSLCRSVDSVFGEFHFNKGRFPTTFAESNVTFATSGEARSYTNELLQAIALNPTCKTEFSMGDGESYLHDGIPWPLPASDLAHQSPMLSYAMLPLS